MTGSENVLGLITARGGSKGIPGKNLADLGGRPLITWTVSAGLACPALHRIIVSTDDEDIAEAARQAGAEVPFLRPAALAANETPSMDVVMHALDAVGKTSGVVVLLQPTSPFRTSDDISACLRALDDRDAPCAVTVTETTKTPEWMFRLDDRARLCPATGSWPSAYRRQDLAPAYALNGAVYAARVAWLRDTQSFLTPQTVAVEMPAERSLDIDTPFDLQIARAIFAKNESNHE